MCTLCVAEESWKKADDAEEEVWAYIRTLDTVPQNYLEIIEKLFKGKDVREV